MTDNILANNLRAIREKDPALANRLLALPPSNRIQKKASGKRMTITVKAPDAEGALKLPDLGAPSLDTMAEELFASRMAVVLGFGSGKLFAEAVERTSPQTFVLLVEPDIDLFAAIISQEDFSRAFELERVFLAVGEKPHAATIIRAEEAFSLFTITNFPVLENSWSAGLYAGYFAEVKNRLAELMAMGKQNTDTLAILGAEWRKNILENLPAIVKSPPVSSLFGKFAGVPAIIVAAGPSLDKNIRLLSSLANSAIIIAVDTAVRSLLLAGVEPHIVVALDSQMENYRHLAGVKLPNSLYALNPVVNPLIVKERRGPMVFTGYTEPLFEWVETVIGERGSVRTGGSVATSAFDLAMKMGCSPVIFIGQDLCYSATATHADGTMQTAASGLAPGKTAGVFPAINIFGEQVLTNHKMESWRRWFELLIPSSPAPALNATEGGVKIAGAQTVSLAEAVARRFSQGAVTNAPSRMIDALSANEINASKLAEALATARAEARFIKTACAKGLNAVKASIPLIANQAGVSPGAMQSLDDMRERARDILTRELFAKINRYHMERTLDRVEEIRRKSDQLENRERMAMSIEAYRELFSGIYEIASTFEREVDKALTGIGDRAKCQS
ncbi:MAG: motility associated factor glycosyltransferase family protein [Nitrospinae bacterium]|nr:motility associated factor glycosyltransferase family protein [Nitrospinota bacterium]MBF0633077.1 motility associated factor glycosyltransferase family protein [Nitrospinota bacterium]